MHHMDGIYTGKKKSNTDFFVLLWRRHHSFCLSCSGKETSKAHIGPIPDYVNKLEVPVLLSNSYITKINEKITKQIK